ncbi:MAG: hypothetical protein K1X75_15480 [Leptospirales bacterium]|nr:hypothetical protein [Leptospirales bacterium]
MQALSVLVGVYAERVYRISVVAETLDRFPPVDFLNSQLRVDRLAVHRDSQGMFRARRKSMRFLCDPATGLFSILGNRGELLAGSLQTGAYQPASFSVRLHEHDRVHGFGAATGALLRNEQSFQLLNLDTLFYSIKGASYSSFPIFLIRRKDNSFLCVLLNLTTPSQVQVRSDPAHPDGPGIYLQPLQPPALAGFDFFVIEGELPSIVQRVAELSGKPFLPPLWSLGFHQSRWSYRSAERVLQIARRFRELQLPLDAIHLDIDYMDRYRVFTWHPRNFPDPVEMHRKLSEMGVRTVAIVDPGVAQQSDYGVYQRGAEAGAFCLSSEQTPFIGKVWPGRTAFPDFTQPAVRRWWSEEHGALFAAGVSGIWNDMNDPVLWMGKKYDPLHQDVLQADGQSLVRNTYANLECQATNESFARHTGLRPFVLTRSAFTGIQKYAAVWTGDNHSSWDHLRQNLNMIVNLGLSGAPFCGADVGGFSGGHPFQGVLKAIKLIKNPELFSRWMELGALMPFFRVHTALYSHAQEPWSFGPDVLENSRKHMHRRYRLLPYIYSLAWEMHLSGAPLVRPLFYHYPEMRDTEADTQFMLGTDLLAAPVLEKGARLRRVALPPGEWYEFESMERYAGAQVLELSVRPGYYPLFVRAGAILPCCSVARNAVESVAGGLILECYPAKAMEGRVRLDDGVSVQSGVDLYEQAFRGEQDRSGNILISTQIVRKKYTPPFQQLRLRLPPQFRVMSLRGKQFEGRETPLNGEDRSARFFEFDVPLNFSEASFDYRLDWQ